VHVILFPNIDPVALQLGPLAIRWYALAYLAGFILGWRYCLWLARDAVRPPTARDFDDFLTWAVIGTILGGRLGEVLFYHPGYYFSHPAEILQIWHGGMSFHGGLLGVIAAILLYARRGGFSPLLLGDVVACAAPIGLFFGRIANFINGELWGRPTDVPWAVLFPDPRAGGVPRHPSQFYEAFLEGVVLFTVMAVLARRPALRARPGLLCGIFLIGYGIARSLGELFRDPDPPPVPLGGLSMGQLLSLPMILVGIAFVVLATRRRAAA
jgi:phosphatidylglycerol:prolipoprotein diacylglycerol transferase